LLDLNSTYGRQFLQQTWEEPTFGQQVPN
jgi:hypothetical protein